MALRTISSVPTIVLCVLPTVLQCSELHAQLAALLKEKADLEESCSVLAENFSQAGAKLSEQKEELVMQLASLQEAQQTVGELQRQIASEHEHREEVGGSVLLRCMCEQGHLGLHVLCSAQVELRMVDMTSKMYAASEEASRSAVRESKLQALLDDKQVELSHQGSCVEALERQLEGALGEVQLLRNWLSEVMRNLYGHDECLTLDNLPRNKAFVYGESPDYAAL